MKMANIKENLTLTKINVIFQNNYLLQYKVKLLVKEMKRPF